jgi:hypothetical protein
MVQVISKLSEIDTKLHILCGSGQPGMFQLLQNKVDTHQKALWVLAGVIAAYALLHGAGSLEGILKLFLA